jgi:hypothetical protein
MPALTPRARTWAAALGAAGVLLLCATGCTPARSAAAPQPTATQAAASSPAVATSGPPPATASASPSTRIAPANEFGNGTVYDALITSVTPGSPHQVTMEMAWHYTGQAASAYAQAHGLPAPTDDHIDVDRKFSATVAVSPALQASTNPEGAGAQQLSPAAFLAWAGAHPAARFNGQYAGPLYAVTFTNDALVSANQIFEP